MSQISSDQQALAEEGLPLPQPTGDSAESMPVGGGRLVIPHQATFSQITNLLARTYRWTFDEALKSSSVNALAIRRDPVIMDALRARQIPVAQLSWHLEAQDDTDPAQVEAVKGITADIEAIPNFQQYRMHLQEAVWYGRYGVQGAFAWDFSTGKRRMRCRLYRPINGDKLVFRFSGQIGVLIHSTFKDDNTSITDRGRAHFFTPEEREQVVVHKHEPEDADFWEGDMAGAIFGVGIRSRIYWLWWLRSQVTAFLMDYLERVGAGGFTVYYYEAGSTTSLEEVKAAAEEQHRNNTILFPRYRDGSTGGPGVERVEASQAGASLLSTLITEYFDNIIRRFILGQTLSSEAEATGMGSGVADLQADTLSKIIKYDAVNLQETLTQDLVAVLCKYNHPGTPCPRFVFDVDKPNAAETLEAAKNFYEMGGQVDEDELRSILGLSKPQPGHNVLAKLPSMAPAGVGALPTGVPMSGTPGPDQGAVQGAAPPQGGGQGDPNGQVLFERRGRRLRLAALKTGLGRFVRNGHLDLYHYTPSGDEELELDPERLGKNAWSKREKQAAQTPRTFFYLDPSQKESYFESHPEYRTRVPAHEVYDLGDDPDNLVSHVVRKHGYPLSMDDVLGEVKARGFKGVAYSPGGMNVVAWMHPIKVRRQDKAKFEAKGMKASPATGTAVSSKPPKKKAGMGVVPETEQAATPAPEVTLPGTGKKAKAPKPASLPFSDAEALTGQQAVDIAHGNMFTHNEARRWQIENLGKSLAKNDRDLWGQISDDVDDEQLKMLKAKDMAKLLDAWRDVTKNAPDIMWHEAVKGGIVKRGWYRKVMPAIQSLFPNGDDAKRFIAVLAATSPRVSVTNNLVGALDIWHAWNKFRLQNPEAAHDPKAVAKMLNDLDASWKKQGTSKQVLDKKTGKLVTQYSPRVDVGGEMLTQGTPPAFGSHLSNVVRALSKPEGYDWDKGILLSGPKVESFRRNLSGHLDHATNDAWMSFFAGIDQKEFSGRNSPDEHGTRGVQKPYYMAFTAKTRNVARQLNAGLAVGERPWSAAEVQETVWTFFRGLSKFIGQQKLHNKRTVTPGQALEEITHEHLADTVDFLQEAMQNPDVSKRLKQILGPRAFGQAVKRLRGIDAQVSSSQGKEKSGRAIPSPNPVLERIAGRAAKHDEAFASGKVKNSAATAGIRVNLSPFLKGVIAYLHSES